MIITSADVGLALHCRYEMKNATLRSTLLSGLEVKSAVDTADFYEETVVDSPNVVMRVTNVNGDDVVSAQVRNIQFSLPCDKEEWMNGLGERKES